MNRIVSIFIITVTLILLSGCTDWLDIRPESDVVLEEYWKNESHVNQVLASCYRSLTDKNLMGKMLVWGELRSDNVTFGNDTPEDMYKILNIDISPANGYCHWGSAYTVINYCNNFLHYAPDVVKLDPNFTESKLQKLEAEVLTIRALVYFYLVRTFGEVPWIEDPSIDDTQEYNIPKTSEDIILNHLVEDLEWALGYARDNFGILQYDKGRITRNAVRALLADIYLWQEEYTKCIETCDKLLNDTEQELELVDGENVLSNVFYVGNSSESIFELQFDDDTRFNDIITEFYGFYQETDGYWSFPEVLVNGEASPFNYRAGINIESEKDLREKDFLRPERGGDKYYVFKYAGAVRIESETANASGEKNSSYFYRSVTANWIVYRLPDIILMKAEALIQLESNMSEALKLINQTYLRSNPEATSELMLQNYNSKLEMEKLLLRERQRELMFEGKRYFDLMRLARRSGSPSPLLGYVGKKYTGTASSQLVKMSVMDALYMPIHNDELKANNALIQNPYYELTAEGSN